MTYKVKMRLVTFLAVFVLLVPLSFSQSVLPKNLKCPVDGTVFSVKMNGNFSTDSTLADLQKTGRITGMYENMIFGCPKCYYSGYEHDFALNFSGFAKKEIKQLIAPFKTEKLTDLLEVEIAAKVHTYFGHNNDNIAYIYLIGSYIAKNEPYTVEQRKRMQQLAIDSYLKALEKEEYAKGKVKNNVFYLVGELYRRIGDFDQSLQFFNEAMQNADPNDWIYERLLIQKKLSEQQNDDNSL